MIMKKCSECALYTIKSKCVNCEKDTISCHPMTFSLSDKYYKYRTSKGKL